MKCQTCTHFKPCLTFHPLGTCENKLLIYAEDGFDPSKTTGLQYSDSEQYSADMRVGPGFGCIHYESSEVPALQDYGKENRFRNKPQTRTAMDERLKIIREIARAVDQGWKEIDFQPKSAYMISFARPAKKGEAKIGRVRINVYPSTMTVATALDHPKSGKTQMFRKRISEAELIKIFLNPRWHSQKGYR